MTAYLKINPRFITLAETLIASDPVHLRHINLDTILFYNKIEKNAKKLMEIKGIKEPLLSEFGKAYIIEINEHALNGLSEEHVELHLYSILRQIDYDPGKLKKPDIVDFADIVTDFGHDWKQRLMIPSVSEKLMEKHQPKKRKKEAV